MGGDFKSNEDDYANGGHSFPSEKFKGNNVDDDDFPPSEDSQYTDEHFQETKKDDEEFPSSGDFETFEDDYANGGHNVDDDFPPNDYVDDDVLNHSTPKMKVIDIL